MASELDLDVLAGSYAVARLDPGSPVPEWAYDRTLCALILTARELTVVCPATAVPDDVPREGPFRALAVRGPLDFALTGILEALARPLAEASIPIFALSTFDTDLVLVRDDDLAGATAALRAAGHLIHG